MRKLFIITVCLFFVFDTNKAQQNGLFVPRNIQQAIENQTRTTTGEPGVKYWQNKAKYDIKAAFSPQDAIIRGTANITYTNNSPNSLDYVVLRLYQNLFQKGTARNRYITPSDIHDGVQIIALQINGATIDVSDVTKVAMRGTFMNIQLPQNLNTADSVKITVEWKTPLPKNTLIRMGRYDQSWMVAYWYPQVGVYDDINEWDMIEHNGLQEFFFEFADYQVEITAPAPYIVWASGQLQDMYESLDKKIGARFGNARKSDEVINVVTKKDIDSKELTRRKSGQIQWKFKATNIPDFAFAASPNYLWDAMSVVVDSTTNRRVVVNVVYKPETDWASVAKLTSDCIKYLSFTMPGVPFPYPQMTIFEGSDGMEFPMMVNQGNSESYAEVIFVTLHEVSHTYFPFYMGINQQRYAWMDEAWAMFLPWEFEASLRGEYSPLAQSVEIYDYYAGTEDEVQPMRPSYNTHGTEYFIVSYYRGEVAYAILQNIMGRDKFTKALQTYMARWNGKHPTPYDFFNTFEQVHGKSLTWFWQTWFFDLGVADLAIDYDTKTSEIVVSKIGHLPVPVEISVVYADGSTEKLQHTAEIWADGKNNLRIKTDKKITSLSLGSPTIPDANPQNNDWQ